MSGPLSSLSTFHLTGDKSGSELGDIAERGLRPALFSAYPDLSKLRHDFPLVLTNGALGSTFARSLTSIINGLLQKIAPRGVTGERIRKHVLGLEEEIRTLVYQGKKGTLLQLWDQAETKRLSAADEAGRTSLAESLSRARAALEHDGELVGCDSETPVKVLTHAWLAVQERKMRSFAEELGELTIKLSNILKADTLRSEKALGADALKLSVGSIHEATFDFEVMSDILGSSLGNGALSNKRRRRVGAALAVLESQRFFESLGKAVAKGRRKDVHAFTFDRCSRALEAFRERLPEMVELIKAMTIARLEVEGRYSEERHDAFFRRFDERFVEPEDLARFPSYLVCLRNGTHTEAEKAAVAEVLSSGLPMKVLVQSDDILGEPSSITARFSLGIRGSQLAATTIGLNTAYVLQSAASALYRMRESFLHGLMNGGPVLFSIFSGLAGTSQGAGRNAPETTPYLRAAAALDSRAFPTFVFDPARGDEWASRFSVAGNLQAESEWPVHRFLYQDQDRQRMSEDVALTFVDFAAVDGRYAASFADVPRSEWCEAMVPVDKFLKLNAEKARDKIPYILMLDEANVLHKVIVDIRLIEAARRCRGMWRNFQELAGIDNSHARKLLAQEREIWEREKQGELAALGGRLAAAIAG